MFEADEVDRLVDSVNQRIGVEEIWILCGKDEIAEMRVGEEVTALNNCICYFDHFIPEIFGNQENMWRL